MLKTKKAATNLDKALNAVDRFAATKPFPIRPLEDRIIVRRDEAADTTPGGLFLPDSVKEKKLHRGLVVRVGPGKDGKALPVAEGQRVIFAQYAGWDLPEHDGHVMMRIDDVLGVLER